MSEIEDAGLAAPGRRTVEEEAAFWNARAAIENPIAVNGYLVGAHSDVPLDPDVYNAAVIQPVLDRLDLEPQHHVLEVGCGTGLMLKQLESRATRTVGTDISEALLQRYTGTAETYVCAAHKLPFEAESFDRILLAGVVPCFPSLSYFRGVVADLIGLLRSPGRLVISDITLRPEPPGSPYLQYEPLDVIDILEQHGVSFSIESQSILKRAINRRYNVVVDKD